MDSVALVSAAWLLVMAETVMAQSAVVTKTVSDPVLSAEAFVEFTIDIENEDLPQDDVVVEDMLPEGLVIPDGTAPAASKGDYDPATGLWTLGDMAADEVQSLRIPAQVVADPLPACIVNYARSYLAVNPDITQSLDSAILAQPDSGPCVDLQLWAIPRVEAPCTRFNRAFVDGDIVNGGTDFALDVRIVLEDGPDVPRGMAFSGNQGSGCASITAGGTVCNIGTLPPGRTADFGLISNELPNSEVPVDYEITLTATSAETDGRSEPESVTVSWTQPPPVECDSGIDSGIGDPCFVATAAYGSPMHPYVKRLREFRDRVLLPTHAGRMFVDYYYRYSPPVADYIAERPTLRGMVRVALWPLVFAIAHPLTLLCGMLGLLIALVGWRNVPRHANCRIGHGGGPNKSSDGSM